MSQWLQSAKATVSAGASFITFTDSKDFASVRAGDVVMINGQIWQCASGTRPDSTGQSTVTLAAPWPYTGASNVNAFVFRTTHDLLQLTSDARKLTNITKALLAAQEDILTGTTPTINVPIGLDPATGNEEVIEVTPWQYVINTVNASLGNISAIGAMSQVQFEAIREQNKEKYAASAWVSFGNHESGRQVNECKPGLYTLLTTPNTLLIGTAGGVGGSKTDHGVLCIAGVIFHLPLVYPVRLAQAPDGKTTYNKSTGVITNHATVAAAFNAQAADPVNVEVVINRVDMWGFEAFPQEVTPANPEIYPQGVFSDLFSSMNGIATSDSARPVSYFGFLGKKAKKVDFFALSDAQKKKVLADPKNNLYYSDDGRLIQWVLRGREFAGAGNGDWKQINSVGENGMFADSNSRFLAQGIYEISNSIGNDGIGISYLGFLHTGKTKNQDLGIFSGRHASLSAIEGECYLIVCGTVNRLNQGAYHFGFNPSGTKFLQNKSTSEAGGYWYLADQYKPQSTADCFIRAYMDSGGIISQYSGRPDGRFYDGICADGQGGICRDMRYSAYGLDAVDFAEADQRVKNGFYRGFEKLAFSKVIKSIPNNSLNGLFLNKDNDTIGWVSGYVPKGANAGIGVSTAAKVYAVLDGLVIAKGKVNSPERIYSDGSWYMLVSWDIDGVPSSYTYACNDSSFLIIQDEKPYSVGGSFLQTDVIAPPANILANPDFTNGWQGSWVNPTDVPAKLYRKALLVPYGSIVLKNGAWALNSAGYEIASNTVYNHVAYEGASVSICQYKAISIATEPARNAVIYGGRHGVGTVFYTQIHSMSHITEMFFGKLLNSWGPNAPYEGERASESYIMGRGYSNSDTSYWGKLAPFGDEYSTRHGNIIMGYPSALTNIAVKILNYNVSINQQAFPHYAYTELKHNGTNWGDDGKVTIVDNQSTKTDLNGNTVLVGTAKLKEPIGWIKNKV